MYYTYVLKSIEKRFVYIGHTNNLESRLLQHNRGSTRSTKAYRPLKLMYFEKFSTRLEAAKREKVLKTGSNREIFRSMAYKNGEVPKWLKGTHC